MFRKLKADDLLREQAQPAITSMVSPHRVSVADGLTPARLGKLMRQADRGLVERYFILAEEMEERETHFRSVLGTRKMGVSGSPVRVDSASDAAHDQAIAEHVEDAIVKRPEFEGLLIDLMDGVNKGISLVEILWQRDATTWEPRGYEFRPQRHFKFDADTLTVPLLLSLENPNGEPLKPFSWLVHRPKLLSGIPLRSGLARTVAIAYAAKRYTVADWLAFLDVYGMPLRIGKYPSNMVSKKAELLKALRQLGSDAAAAIPSEMQIDLVESKSGTTGGALFLTSAEYWDKQVSKVVLGQTMTSDDGASLAQSKTHERVRFDIRDADARACAATINRDLIEPFVQLNYGPQEHYPKVVIVTEEPEDTDLLMKTTRVFVNLGGKVQMTEVRDRLGYAEPEEGAELLLPERSVSAPAEPDKERDEPSPSADDDAEELDDDEPENDDGGDEETRDVPDDKSKEANRSRRRGRRFARTETEDIVDVERKAALEDWKPLVDENVGRLLARVQSAASYEEARAALDELARDEGEQLALDAITALLARSTFKLRGVGDATDDTEE